MSRALTDEQVTELRALRRRDPATWTHHALSEHYGVSRGVIVSVLHHRGAYSGARTGWFRTSDVERGRELRAEGLTLEAVADVLQEEAGRRPHPSTVSKWGGPRPRDPRRFSDEVKERALELRGDGLSYGDVAYVIGCEFDREPSRQTVLKWCKGAT